MINYKKILPYLIAILSFIVIAYMFTPQVFSGKVVNQGDIASWRGMANEIISYNEANPDKDPALWTNSMFSGMPATTISVVYDGDFTDYLYKILFVGQRPPSYLLISLIGSFLLFLAFGVNVWLSLIGAIAISFCSYNMQLIQVGHNSKMVAIAFMPWVLAAVVYAYRKKALLGALLFAFALSFQIKANHPQITYYLAIIIAGYAIALLYTSIKDKYFLRFLRTSVYLLIAGAIGIATNINHLWPTYEYSKYTMRGGSELAKEKGTEQKGLEIAYATQWSYSPGETPNLLIPNYNGGSSVGELSKNSESYKVLQSGFQGAEQIIKQMPLYWGPQPFTAGPMYLGAISIFLFILGFILLRGATKWWIASVSLLALLLSWGSNFLPVTEFFFNYIPLYNKFRTVSMILVILQITIPLLAFLTVDKLLKGEYDQKKVKTGLIISLAITAGFSLIMAILPSLAGSFTGASDTQLPEQLRGALVQDRQSLLSADAFRSLVFILLAGAALWFTILGKLKKEYMFAILGVLIIADMWSVDKRYLNDSHFVKNRDFEQQYSKRPVDEMILQDKDPNYRVLDLSINTFNDAHVSYHHKTIGGYSPAKLQRYQDLIDNYIIPEMQQIGKDLTGIKTIEEAQAKFGNYPILNMLNTRYIVIGAQNPPLVNHNALGNGWFVNEVKVAGNVTEEIAGIGAMDLSRSAVVSKEFEAAVAGIPAASVPVSSDTLIAASETSLIKDSVSSPAEFIKLTYYSPNELTYEYTALTEKLAVFSEVYYPKGWTAYIDGQPAEIINADFILRALKVPAGTHKVEFRYKPESFTKGAMYSRISSGLLILLLLAGIGGEIYSRRRAKAQFSVRSKETLRGEP
ncbi:MAG: YfhO family protein [Bacteroidales bacterium]|nr:YfhO family protein [Bacteroidales bacterium]